MSHYDCDNCGATMGIAFGSCNNCTPKEYFQLEKELLLKINELENKFTNMPTSVLTIELHNAGLDPNMPFKNVIDQLVRFNVKSYHDRLSAIKRKHTQ